MAQKNRDKPCPYTWFTLLTDLELNFLYFYRFIFGLWISSQSSIRFCEKEKSWIVSAHNRWPFSHLNYVALCINKLKQNRLCISVVYFKPGKHLIVGCSYNKVTRQEVTWCDCNWQSQLRLTDIDLGRRRTEHSTKPLNVNINIPLGLASCQYTTVMYFNPLNVTQCIHPNKNRCI